MGSKGSNTTTSQSSSGPPPQVMAEYQGLVDRATNVANQPYQPYQGEQVAPLSNQTLTGLGGINQAAGAAQPYLGAAGAMTLGASAPVNPEQFQGMGSLQNYMNPYTSSVVDATQAEMNNQNQQQAQFLNSANISSGAFGGDRAGIGQSILANQQQLAEAPTVAGLNQANYNQAMSNWQNQQGVNLAAQQANASRQMSGAAQLGSIGETAQQAGLQGAQAQIQAGMIPQQEQQAVDTAAQNMYQTSQAYPFTTTGWLGNIVEGTGSLSGGQSQSSTTAPAPNPVGQALGAGAQGIGLLGSLMSLSDERAKENVEEIGKTYDGQNIYRYNFKGDPRTQIGLIAQEEAYHDPGSVKRIGMGDLLGIDYRGATDDAAERGHFADGGMPQQQGAPPPSGQGVDYDLMMSGDPGARAGLGSTMGILGGTNMHPNPGFDTVPLRPSGMAPRQSFQSGGTPQPLGPNGQFGYYTPGFDPTQDELSGQAGVSEALFGELSAGSKTPYTGIDTDQIAAIGGGQWMPPRTNSPMPDWQNLQNSPQFGAAESSLAGMFGDTEASATAPGAGGMSGPMPIGGAKMPGAMGAAGATMGGLSRGQLGDIADAYFGGGAGGGAAGGGGMGSSAGGFSYTPGSVPAGTDTLDKPAPAPPAAPAPVQQAPRVIYVQQPAVEDQNRGGWGGPGAGASGSGGGSTGYWRGGDVTMNNRASGGRAGFAGGGFPQFTQFQPTANQGRNPPTYSALDLSHLFGGGQPSAISLQRQLQGQARAKAAVQRGVVRPRVIAQDPTTGQHHDITPQGPLHDRPPYPSDPLHDRPPFGTGPYSPGGPPLGPTTTGVIPSRGFGRSPGGPETPEPPLDESWKTKPYGGRSTNYGPQPEPAPAPEAAGPEARTYPMPEPESPGEFVGRLPGRVARALPGGRLIDLGRRLISPDPTAGPTGVELPRSLGRSPSGPGPTINAGPPQSHVTDLGTWGDESPAPPPRDFSPPPGKFNLGPPKWGGPPPADIDSEIMNMGDEGPQRFRGGRIGRADGGASANMPFPGQEDPSGTWAPPPTDVSKMSDADFASALKGDMSSAPSGDLNWIDSLGQGPSNSDWNALAPGGGDRTGKLQLNPQSVAQQPTFQGGGGGGGGGGYHGVVTNMMGGPPITAGDFSGFFKPTTGNARGSTYVPGVSPNATAQAPEHPAIKVARHIASQAHAAGFAAGHKAGRMSRVDPNMGPFLSDKIDTSYGPQQPPAAYGHSQDSPNFQGGGGVMGSSPIMNAGGYTPQGMGLTGQTSQGGGLGSIAAASGAAGGFGDLFGGGGRAGFADGGGSDIDPLLAAIQASSGAGARMGPGPPQAVSPPKAPEGPGGQQTPGDSLKGLNDVVKAFKANQGVQTTPTGTDGSAATPAAGTDASGGWGDIGQGADVSGDFAALDDSTFDLGTDVGFATGGGVGLGSLRGNFQDGGDPTPDQIDAEVAGAGPAGAPVAAPAPTPKGGGGEGGGVPTDRGRTTAAQRAQFIRSYIGSKYPGADPNIALGVAGAEGLGVGGSGPSTVDTEKSGPNIGQPFSFGDFQMNIHPGALGDMARKAGYDPADPNQWQGVDKYAIDQMYGGKGGLNLAPWKGDKYAEAYLHSGKAPNVNVANLPSGSAQPAMASTDSYGGGFQLPGQQPQQQLSRPPTMGDEIKRDPFGYMMTVGAGMMASRSPFLGTMAGEGFEAGNKYLGSMQALDREWGLNQAQINNLSAEAREHGADADYKVIQTQIAQRMAKIQVAAFRDAGINVGDGGSTGGSGGAGGSGTGIAPVAPLPTVGGGAGAGAAPAGGAAPSGGPGAGTAPAGAGAGQTKVADSGAPAPGETGAGGSGADLGTYTSDPDYIEGTRLIKLGGAMNIGGGTAGNAYIDLGKQKVEAAKTTWEARTSGIKKGLEESTAGDVKATNEQDATVREGNRNRPALAQRAQAILDLIDSGYKPGAGADWKADVVRYIKAAGFDPASIGLDPSTAASYQEFIKNSSNMVMESVKAMPGTPRVAEIKTYEKASPNAELEPEANRAILSQAMGLLDYQDEYGQGYMKWRHGEGKRPTSLSLGDYDDQFAHDPKFKGDPTAKVQDYVNRRRARSGIKPDALPGSASSYQYDKGTGQWRDKGSGKVFDYLGNPVQ